MHIIESLKKCNTSNIIEQSLIIINTNTQTSTHTETPTQL